MTYLRESVRATERVAGAPAAARRLWQPAAHGDSGHRRTAGAAWHGPHPAAASRVPCTAAGKLPLPCTRAWCTSKCGRHHESACCRHTACQVGEPFCADECKPACSVLFQSTIKRASLLRQGGGFGASAGPFMPMHLMGGGFPGPRPGMAPGFGQPQQPAAPRTREVRRPQHTFNRKQVNLKGCTCACCCR